MSLSISQSRPIALTDAYLACIPREDIPRVLRFFELARDLYALARELRMTAWEIGRWAAQPAIQMCLTVDPTAHPCHRPRLCEVGAEQPDALQHASTAKAEPQVPNAVSPNTPHTPQPFPAPDVHLPAASPPVPTKACGEATSHVRFAVSQLSDQSSDQPSEKPRARTTKMWTPLTGILVGVVAATGLSKGVEAVKHKDSDYKFFDEIIEVKHILDKSYVYDVDDKKLAEGALKGMVEALGDQYTVFVPGSEAGEFTKGLTGEYVGIGASVNTDSGWLTIVSPLEDSPALRAGLMPDDRVLEIDGKTTQHLTVEQCIELLQGTPNTPVVLKVERKNETLDITIIRDRIKTKSIKGFHRDPSDPQKWEYLIDRERRIGYIRMTQFTPGVASELYGALLAMKAEQGLGGLVLDLRFNPGGVLEEAVAIADMFLKEGVIVSTKGRAFEERISRAKAEGTLADFPIIVMLNDQSASASEVLAGALVDNDRAKVLGVRSFGKGSVQGVLKLSQGDGSEIKVTQQAYYLPSGRNITRKDDSLMWGVDPSPGFYVPMEDKDLVEMLTQRRKQELISIQREEAKLDSAAPTVPMVDWSNTDTSLEQLKDTQLTSAIRAMQQRIDKGDWAAPGSDAPQLTQTIQADELKKSKQFRERLIREIVRADKRIETLEAGKPLATTKDLWDDAKDVSGGTMEIKDKDGNVIATLKITGNNVERWLIDADVEKKD